MTSLATIIGLLPMALKLGTGSEAYAPLARAIIGGLMVSVALTVFVVPAAYLARLSRPERDERGGAMTCRRSGWLTARGGHRPRCQLRRRTDVAALSLTEAEQRALQNHPQILEADYGAEAAGEAVREARSAYCRLCSASATGAEALDSTRITAGGLNNPTDPRPVRVRRPGRRDGHGFRPHVEPLGQRVAPGAVGRSRT